MLEAGRGYEKNASRAFRLLGMLSLIFLEARRSFRICERLDSRSKVVLLVKRLLYEVHQEGDFAMLWEAVDDWQLVWTFSLKRDELMTC